jgi:transposase
MARRRIGVADVKEILVQWDAGAGISAIARSLGYTRPTVRKYVEAGKAAGLARGEQRRREAGWEQLARDVVEQVAALRTPGTASAAVGLFHTYIDKGLHPAADAGRDPVRPSVLYQRLRDEQGLGVSWGTFYRYVRRHWPEQGRQPAQRVTVRLDDPPPGEEAQIDFFYVGRWFDPEEQRLRRLYAFLMTLAHSRHQFVYPVLGEDSRSWLEAHVEAFKFFGGAPKRLVPDNLSAGIVRADLYDPRLNRAYGELSRYYGCIVDPARVRHPKDKAKVERGVSYARESFFRGRDFQSLAEMRSGARTWCLDVAGRRQHGTTGERPLEAFLAREQPALLPLPPKPWEQASWTTAKVHPDCHLQAAGARYSVPFKYVGKRLDVRLGDKTVEIYDGASLITSHLRRERGRQTKLEHYPEAGQAFLRATPQACLNKARTLGLATGALVAGRLEVHALHTLREVQSLLRLAERYEPERLERACQRAIEAGDARYRTVRGILERGYDQQPPEAERQTALVSSAAFLRGPAAFAMAGGQS